MISYLDGTFRLDTANTSYIFRVTRFGHLETIHYGEYLQDQSLEAIMLKHTAVIGSTVAYDASDPMYSLDTLTLEWSGICLLYTSPSPRDGLLSRMPSSA